MEDLEKKLKQMEKKQVMMAAAGASGAADEDDKDGGGAGQDMFKEIEERLDNHEKDIKRLLRIDFRLNKELVQKPYTYIDNVKDNIVKEIFTIAKTVKTNNEKYLTKIGSLDSKISEVVLDGKKLIIDYGKKIEGIKRDK